MSDTISEVSHGARGATDPGRPRTFARTGIKEFFCMTQATLNKFPLTLQMLWLYLRACYPTALLWQAGERSVIHDANRAVSLKRKGQNDMGEW